MRLTHFYHVYADGQWQKPASEHFNALVSSELIDNLSDMFLGVVGSEENREQVKKQLPGVVVAEADTGWEQITLGALHKFAQTDDGGIFYAHTKGAWSVTDLSDAWRVSMTHDTVTRWRECVDALRNVDAAGPYWLRSNMPEHSEHGFFFAGNFWWAKSSYIRGLDPVSVVDRYRAEGWVGLGNPVVKNMRDGFSYWGNFWSPNGTR